MYDKISGSHGDTSTDFSSNDITVPYVSDDDCEALCFDQTNVIIAANTVTEECWGFTTTATECIAHVVVKPSFFDTAGTYYALAGSNFFKKRCFDSEYNCNVVIPVLSGHSINYQNWFSRLIIAQCRSKVLQNAPREHSAILSTCNKLPSIFVLSILEWPLMTGFTVCLKIV